MKDFLSIMTDYGFTPDQYDFESTIIGFDYEIQSSLLGANTCFDTVESRVYRQWNQPNEYLYSNLKTLTGDIDAGIQFFHRCWRSELYQQHSIREIIDTQRLDLSATIRVLTISKYNAMTFRFHIS